MAYRSTLCYCPVLWQPYSTVLYYAELCADTVILLWLRRLLKPDDNMATKFQCKLLGANQSEQYTGGYVARCMHIYFGIYIYIYTNMPYVYIYICMYVYI